MHAAAVPASRASSEECLTLLEQRMNMVDLNMSSQRLVPSRKASPMGAQQPSGGNRAAPVDRLIARSEVQHPAGGASSQRILVIDDDPAILALLIRLARHGYRIEIAVDGARGLDLMRSGHYTAILLGHALSGRMGPDLLETMYAEGARTPVILLTKKGDDAVVLPREQLGTCRYSNLATPFTPRELMAAIAIAVADSRVRLGAEELSGLKAEVT